MPLYIYHCIDGHETEALEKFDAPSTRDCICGAPATRVITGTNFRMGTRPPDNGPQMVDAVAR